jgi:hypothetical protein
LNTHWENFLADGSKVSEKEVSSLTYTKVLWELAVGLTGFLFVCLFQWSYAK